MVRGDSKYTEPGEKGFGEYFFYRLRDQEAELLSLNKNHADTYKLFRGSSSVCSKSHGYHLGQNKIAILFLKENNPFKHKLVIQLFDMKALSPLELIETSFSTDRVEGISGGFVFRTSPDKVERDMGKVKIAAGDFLYHESDFPQWMMFTQKGLENLNELTFKKFQWKKFFKDQNDFNLVTGWDARSKSFSRDILYVAVNHTLRKRCLLFLKEKESVKDQVAWRCQAM